MNGTTCIDLLKNKSAYTLLFHLNPVDSETPIWEQRSELWRLLFIVFTAIYSFFYFKLGLLSLVMIIKRNCARLPTKTFIVIYTCLAILGFSRGLLLTLDPYGMLGWIMTRFRQWIIISRMLAVLGFPSITAAFTLVFLTLYKSTELGTSRLWVQNWRVVVFIAAVHYLPAVGTEAIANIAPYPALLSVIICEGVFTLWGVLICIFYLFAGGRLRRRLKGQCSKAVRRCLSTLERHPPVGLREEEYRKHYRRIAKTVRKIGLISYGTAILGILYAAVSAAALIMVSIFAFHNCFGLNGLGHSVSWFAIKVASRSMEIPLAFVMLYSVTDVRGVLQVIRGTFCCCFTSNRHKTTCQSAPTKKTSSQTSQLTLANSTESRRPSRVSTQLTQLSLITVDSCPAQVTPVKAQIHIGRSDTDDSIQYDYVWVSADYLWIHFTVNFFFTFLSV